MNLAFFKTNGRYSTLNRALNEGFCLFTFLSLLQNQNNQIKRQKQKCQKVFLC